MNKIAGRITKKYGSVKAFCKSENLDYKTTKQVLYGVNTSLLVQISLVKNTLANICEIHSLKKDVRYVG